MRVAFVILLAGCYRSVSEPAPLANKADTAQLRLAMTVSGIGTMDSANRVTPRIDGTTKATLTGLRALLVGFDVKPFNDGSLQYDIYQNGEKLAYVVPDDQSGYVFNVHAISSRVVVSGHPWRVGRAFGGASHLTNCECWGNNPTCYAAGEHIAVNFKRDCQDLTGVDREELSALDGEIVQRVIWSPTPFGEDYGETND